MCVEEPARKVSNEVAPLSLYILRDFTFVEAALEVLAREDELGTPFGKDALLSIGASGRHKTRRSFSSSDTLCDRS